MDSITFYKDTKAKNTWDDWMLKPVEPVSEMINTGLLSFTAHYCDIPVMSRIRDMFEFFKEPVGKAEYASESGNVEVTGAWSVDYTDRGVRGIKVEFTRNFDSQDNSKWNDIQSEKPVKKAGEAKGAKNQKNSQGDSEKSSLFDSSIF